MDTKAGAMFLTSACFIALLGCSTDFAGRRSSPPAIPAPGDSARRLIEAKAELMSADYRADFVALAKWRDLVAPMADDPTLGYLAHYWSGFASWRVALNGASREMKTPELQANLERADAEFDAAVRMREDFSDAYAAGASVNGWLATLFEWNSEHFREHIEKSRRLFARAKLLDPDNPRVLWVEGGFRLFTPAEYGGNPERALEIYRRVAALDPPAAPSASPLPDWGKVEAVMSLAYAHLTQPAPDLAAADAEAREALRLQPDWSYVRDVLRPQIAAKGSELAAKDRTVKASASNTIPPRVDSTPDGAAPGQEHKGLARLVGDWTYTLSAWTSPGQAPAQATGTIHAEPLMGGRYVEHHWTGSFMGHPFEGRGTDGYDITGKRYVSTWIDNIGTGILYRTGTCDEPGRQCSYHGEQWDPATGRMGSARSVVTWLDDADFRIESYHQGPNGRETKGMEIVAKRR